MQQLNAVELSLRRFLASEEAKFVELEARTLFARSQEARTLLEQGQVFNAEEGEFCQVDHIAIGQPGVFLIETKAWDGAFLGKGDRWSRKEGNHWVHCGSPTAQQIRHQRLVSKWLASRGYETIPLHAVVVFTRAQWVRAEKCSLPVLTLNELPGYLKKAEGQALDSVQIRLLAQMFASAAPLPRKESGNAPNKNLGVEEVSGPEVKEGCNKSGVEYVRVVGTKEQAEAVRLDYERRGIRTTDLRSDRTAFFFYILRD